MKYGMQAGETSIYEGVVYRCVKFPFSGTKKQLMCGWCSFDPRKKHRFESLCFFVQCDGFARPHGKNLIYRKVGISKNIRYKARKEAQNG